jgi:hypothetical protein
LIQQPGDVGIDVIAADQGFDEGLGQLRRGNLAGVDAAVGEEAAGLGASRQLVGDLRHQQIVAAQILPASGDAAALLLAP